MAKDAGSGRVGETGYKTLLCRLLTERPWWVRIFSLSVRHCALFFTIVTFFNLTAPCCVGITL